MLLKGFKNGGEGPDRSHTIFLFLSVFTFKITFIAVLPYK